MTRKDRIEQIVRDHHDAFLVEVFGEQGCGLPQSRIEQLKQSGLVTKEGIASHGGSVPVGVPYDPVMYARGIGKYLSRNPEEYEELKGLPDDQWQKKASDILRNLKEEDLRVVGMHHIDDAVHMDEDGNPEISPAIPVPKDKPSAEDYGEGDGREQSLVPVKAPFKGASPMDRAAYRQALSRAGEFCRGLGNVWSEALGTIAAEKWNGEDIEESPSADVRDEVLAKIRETVADAWRRKLDYRTLASNLAKATGDYTRNWERIARTELQAAYNDGVAIDAFQSYGKGAKVARVPERRACSHCKGVFLDKDNNPIVWDVLELVRNGTNVGRAKAAWQATLFPVHPRCMCGTISVPPGMKVLASGRLVRQ